MSRWPYSTVAQRTFDGNDEATDRDDAQPDCSDLDRCKYPDDPDHTDTCATFLMEVDESFGEHG